MNPMQSERLAPEVRAAAQNPLCRPRCKCLNRRDRVVYDSAARKLMYLECSRETVPAESLQAFPPHHWLVSAYTMSPTKRLNDSFSTNCL